MLEPLTVYLANSLMMRFVQPQYPVMFVWGSEPGNIAALNRAVVGFGNFSCAGIEPFCRETAGGSGQIELKTSDIDGVDQEGAICVGQTPRRLVRLDEFVVGRHVW